MRILFLFIIFFVSITSETLYSEEKSKDWERELDEEVKQIDKQEKDKNENLSENSSTDQSPKLHDLNITAAGEIVGEWDRQKPATTENKVQPRSTEIGFSGAVDQWLRGNVIIAAHGENGKFYFEVHEAWVQFPFLPWNVSLKVGQMFIDVGRLNRIHLHDRPFTATPIVHEKLIGRESIDDAGSEFSVLFPWRFIAQELVFGATNGRKFGHSHSDGIKKNNPLTYAHLKNFYHFGNNWGTQFGFSALRFEPTTDRKVERYLYGMDAVLKWNQSNQKEISLMAELWYNLEKYPLHSVIYNPTTNTVSPTLTEYPYPGRPEKKIQWGYYLFANYKFHQLWSIGLRYDFYKDLSIKDKEGYLADNYMEAHSVQVGFISSEYAQIRITAERRFARDYSQTSYETRLQKDLVVTPDLEKTEYRFYAQAIFILGSHPPHNY